jgi:succinate dehydrogenase hydrophobic anchor subunit
VALDPRVVRVRRRRVEDARSAGEAEPHDEVEPHGEAEPHDEAEPHEEVRAGEGEAGGEPHLAADEPGWAWYLVRVSGLFLAVLLPIQFYVVIVRDDVGHTTLRTVTNRFTSGPWQALELVTLLLALLHAFLALRAATQRAESLGTTASARVVGVLAAVTVLLAVGLVWSMLSLS